MSAQRSDLVSSGCSLKGAGEQVKVSQRSSIKDLMMRRITVINTRVLLGMFSGE
jgi:hypothetical protein